LDSLGKSQKGTPRHSDLGELWRQLENHRPTPMKIWLREIRILKNSGISMFFSMDLLVGGFKPSEKYESQWKDDIPYIMENKKCSKPPTRLKFICCLQQQFI